MAHAAATLVPISGDLAEQAIDPPKRTQFIQQQTLISVILSYQLLFGPSGHALLVTDAREVIVLGLMLSVASLMVLPAGLMTRGWFPVGLALFDTMLTTAVIYLSGNASSDLYLTYFLIMVIASTSRTLKELFILSLIVCALYGVVLYLEEGTAGMSLESHFLRIPFLLVMAAFYGFTTETMRKVSQEKSKLIIERNVLANYDPLTGLPNRRMFGRLMEEALARALKSEHLLALLVLDLDDFKRINDTLGHTMGDLLLTAVSARLTMCFRKGDTIARIGGDEFGVFLENLTSSEQAARLAQKFRATMTSPLMLGSHEVVATASIGIALYPLDATDAGSLMKNADTAMNHSKAQGKNSYQFFKSDMNARALRRLLLENSLHKALERDEMILHYQPQVDLLIGEVIGVEALIRWQHQDLGLVSPTQFIPIAEDTGLIVRLGGWALATACAQTKAWHEAGFPGLTVSVNLSARQLKQPDELLELIRRVLEKTGLDPHCLELEITEGTIIQNPESTTATLQALRGLGIKLCIDDFGTGYSSLNYLKRFPVDALKIDQSFVQDSTVSQDGALIIKAIIALAQALKLKVIAEGVENKTQMDFLLEHGCHAVQGFVYSKPVPAEEMAALLARGVDRALL